MSQVMKMKSHVRPHEAARGHRLLRWAWKKFCRGRNLHECRGKVDRTHLHATGGTKAETLHVEQYTIWVATNSLRGLLCQRFVGECLSQNKNGMQTSLKNRNACPRLFNTRLCAARWMLFFGDMWMFISQVPLLRTATRSASNQAAFPRPEHLLRGSASSPSPKPFAQAFAQTFPRNLSPKSSVRQAADFFKAEPTDTPWRQPLSLPRKTYFVV